MAADSTSISFQMVTLLEWIKLIGGIVGIVGGLTTISVVFFTRFLPWYRTKKDNRSLEKRFGADLYPIGVIEQATRYYIEPFCQSLDPSGGEEPRLVYGARENLFSAIDHHLYHPTEYRYLFLLADSGMGKTSFLLNYYTRNLRRRRMLNLELLPLGIPDVDERIARIKDKKDKVLFLDALDEDTLAIVDHVERLQTIMQLTRQFQKVLITCRTQFFPKDEEIPRETGIVKIGPKAAGEKAHYVFHKLYISPFTDQQVEKYLKKRYTIWQFKKRKKAADLVKKIPQLSVRPMLLAHIKDLVQPDLEIKYSFQLYEEMVEAWLDREEGIVEGIKKEPLRNFSECLALDLYFHRKERGAERVSKDKLAEIAQQFSIPLEDWQLTGRSLLNRDAIGNYKFAHRSIMEYLFVKRFLELPTQDRFKIAWTDQMKKFLQEILNVCNEQGKQPPDLTMVDLEGIGIFRFLPATLSDNEVKLMLKKHDFFDSDYNKTGKGFKHQYEAKNIKGDKVVFDHASNLMWQQSGSSNSIKYNAAKKYVEDLNKKGFASFKDWRLPTLEEAMSLMEPEKKKGNLYIDPVFDSNQRWIWTSDLKPGESRVAWGVTFYSGSCYWGSFDPNYYVRAVRSRQSSTE